MKWNTNLFSAGHISRVLDEKGIGADLWDLSRLKIGPDLATNAPRKGFGLRKAGKRGRRDPRGGSMGHFKGKMRAVKRELILYLVVEECVVRLGHLFSSRVPSATLP